MLGIGLNVAVRLEDLPLELRPGGAGHEGEPSAAGHGARAPAETPAGLPAASMGLAREEVEDTLARLLDALGRRLGEDSETALAAWRERDALRGRTVAWSGGRGRAEGIDGAGRLVVALEGAGHTTVGAGEVHIERID